MSTETTDLPNLAEELSAEESAVMERIELAISELYSAHYELFKLNPRESFASLAALHYMLTEDLHMMDNAGVVGPIE